MDIVRDITKIAKTYFRNSRGSHDWEHSERVMKLARHLAIEEQADQQVVQLAAILHDIGRKTQDESNGQLCHAEEGAKLARDILDNYELAKNVKENIVHCIKTHRFRNAHKPETIEAKVLYDADKLDSIGAVGIGRAFLFAGEIGAKLHNKDADISKTKAYTKEDTAYREFIVKLSKVKERMLTPAGRKIALERHNFMVCYFDRLNLEVEGKI
ncbi:MAG: HD domain-containing protein [Fidelibacterota bacterium]